MDAKPFTTIIQTLLDGNERSLSTQIPIHKSSDANLGASNILSVFNHSRPLGLAPGYLPDGKLVLLAISDDKNCRIVEFQEIDDNSFRRNKKSGKTPPEKSLEGRALLQDRVLCRTTGDLYAFDMAPLAMSLHSDTNMRITQAVDIPSAFPDVKDRNPLAIVKDALKDGPEDGVYKIKDDNIKRLFLHPTHRKEDSLRDWITDLAQRAWLAQFLPTFGDGETTFAKVPRIDTKKLSVERLDLFAKLGTDALRMDSKKPSQITHQVTQAVDPTTGGLLLNSQNYNTKLRGNRVITMTVDGPRGSYTTEGSVASVYGRAGSINTGDRQLNNKAVVSVISTGQDGPTLAEAKRAETLLRALQGKDKTFDESPWIQNIWSPAEDGVFVWPKEWTIPVQAPPPPPSRSVSQILKALPNLNPSQQVAVNTMLSQTDEHRLTIIQGPPGTGKTSVIASYVHFSVNVLNRGGIWLIAQSNVAVKNIAEKLISTKFINWRLVVSKDFHFGWHEHIYGKVQANIIRSDQIAESTGRLKLQGVDVVLCTLSMLSNDMITKFIKQIPLTTLVVDEASQIEIGNYLPVFAKFKNLRKMCFIGDNKQLPPHGQEDIEGLRSIFEVVHLQKQVLFLDTQYRMPPQIGRVISKAVYGDKLKSNPLHPIPDRITACYFIDVSTGKEEPVKGGSFKNMIECMAVLKLASKLEEAEKSYKIITPYAAQTATIEDKMKEYELDWADKCFNVDSFQGNEEDFIIISVVRSRGLGFLNNLRRTNVMLSRCKKGMFIISSKQFLTGIGSNTLVGEFLKEMEPATWLTGKHIENGAFLEPF